ncbi:FAD-dependent oxidoreductase [Microbacterium sp. B2969]|uniref:FAD-dependent oxidoreductase n=1 Tax=Microbacterium alkaliflavum TaxID=3248839 RepID=A0ABW7QA44_9MICO
MPHPSASSPRRAPMPDVIVVGAGPVGTLLAGELARRGVEVALLERRASAGDGTRAIGVHAPVLAALEASGITERLLASAVRVSRGEARSGGRAIGVVRFDRLDRRFPFVAALPQAATEAALSLGAPAASRGVAVTEVSPGSGFVRVSLDGREPLRAPIVVVAGGWRARRLVYRPGAVHVRPYADSYLMADVASDADGDLAVVNIDREGVLESFPLPGGRRRFVAWDAGTDASPRRLRTALRARGQDAAADLVTTATRFEVRRAVAPALRRGRLFVVGDTAHEVSPIGGQGMNLGLLDAATLAPLVASWVRTGSEPAAELAAWERRRVASARTAARLAALNTSLGRPLGPAAHAVRRTGLRLALLPPGARLLAHAYAMGFDRDA